jgi:hypothetical protein
VFGTHMQLQAFVVTLQKSVFLWRFGTSVLCDLETKDSLLKFLCQCVVQVPSSTVVKKQSNVKYLLVFSQ